MERLARDKNQSLLQTIVNYGFKKFYYLGPRCSTSKSKAVSAKPNNTLAYSSTALRTKNLKNFYKNISFAINPKFCCKSKFLPPPTMFVLV
jgi:hypothetical protein